MRIGFLCGVAVTATLTIALLAPGAAIGSTVVPLRVEGTGKTLDKGTSYAAIGVRIPLAGETCARIPGRAGVKGATAMGLLGSASLAFKPLRPLRVVEDEFGRRICRVDQFTETDSPFTGWLYRVNHRAPTVAADLKRVRPKDQVLWYFANFGNGVNTGDELFLKAPVRTTPGTFTVRVLAYAFDGGVAPAPDGTVVNGGDAPATTTNGTATVTVAQPGRHALRARGPGVMPDEIPSQRLSVCVATDLDECPAKRGRTIVGSNRADALRGTFGGDRIRARGGRDAIVARAGDDRIKVRKGGRDRVDCGGGDDVVRVSRGDRVASDCEQVIRK